MNCLPKGGYRTRFPISGSAHRGPDVDPLLARPYSGGTADVAAVLRSATGSGLACGGPGPLVHLALGFTPLTGVLFSEEERRESLF